MFDIKPIKAGYEEFEIKIQIDSIENANIVVPTIRGEIAVSVLNCGSEIVINIPCNTKAYFLSVIKKKYM